MLSRAEALKKFYAMSDEEKQKLWKESGTSFIFELFVMSSSAIQKAMNKEPFK